LNTNDRFKIGVIADQIQTQVSKSRDDARGNNAAQGVWEAKVLCEEIWLDRYEIDVFQRRRK
jgi:hypothetical protein